jgi:hypothetical protein
MQPAPSLNLAFHKAKLKTFLAVATCGLATSVCGQVFEIDLPDLLLQPNTAGQSFDLFVENQGGNFPVTGIRVELLVGDGGTEAGGTIEGPSISEVDVITGTIFATPNNNGAGGAGSVVPQLFERSTLTPSGTVNVPAGSSKFATVTFDTTGFGPGTTVNYTLDTGAAFNGPTLYHTQTGDYQPTLLDGTLTVIPEPSHCAAAFGGACLVWAAARRRKTRVSA